MECSAYHTISMVVILLLMSTCNCQDHVFYIRSSDSSHCPQAINVSQCYSLSTLVSEGHLSMVSNISLLFLPGEHFLEQDLIVKELREFQMAYHNGSSLGGATITCTTAGHSNNGSHSIRIQNVSFVKIDSISLQFCGVDVDSSGALQLRSVDHSEITNSKWYESRSSAIFIQDSSSVISDCQLIGGSCSQCSGGGILAENSNVTFTGSTVITNNSVLVGSGGGLSLTSCNVHVNGNLTVNGNFAGYVGGGMLVYNSNCTFNGTVDISGNSAAGSGGGMLVDSSDCIFNEQVEFSGNSAAGEGGGMLVWYSDCNFNEEVEFSNNVAYNEGGGIFVQYSDCTFNVKVGFSNNSADYGGGMEVDNSNCTFYGQVEFSDNSAYYGGGMLVWYSDCTFNEQVEFYNNNADYGGGIEVVYSDCTFNEQVEFSGNSAAVDGGGMAVMYSNCTFNEQAEFSGNSAYSIGGGMAVRYSNCTFNEQVEFSANSAAIDGGGMLVEYSDCTFNEKVKFTINTAYNIGGGIFVEYSDCTFNGQAEFYGNSAAIDGGGMLIKYSKYNFNGQVEFTENSAAHGGGMAVVYSDCTFNEQLEFSNNTAYNIGGGMAVRYSNCTFNEHVKFAINTAYNISGGIFVEYSYCTFNEQVKFHGNSAAVDSGGMLVKYSNYTFNGQVEFSNNSANHGGGMAVGYSNCTFNEQVEFSGNSAAFDGGGMLVRYSDCTFNRQVEFANNTAYNIGGGIFVEYSDCIFNEQVEFSENSATVNGGGMLLGYSDCTFNGQVEFSNNSADYGGGMLVAHSDCSFKGKAKFSNNSADYGGGMDIEHSNCIFYGQAEFYNNSAAYYGGGMLVWYSDCTFSEQIEFSDNGADYGGGMEAENSNCTFYGQVEFSNNMARIGGGMLVGYSDFTFNEQVEISGNSAYVGGGMIVTEDSHCTFNEHVEFSYNSAVEDGGGMAVYDNAQCIFNGTVLFSGNSAGNSGGSITAVVASNITFLSLTNVSTSTAGREGGGILVRDDSLLVMSGEIIMKDNSASSYGGAISLEQSELRMSGSSKITSNSAQYGGAIQAISSAVHISGDHHFENNSADYGGGWSLFGGSSIYFLGVGVRFYYTDDAVDICLPENLSVQFISNHANLYGGAIWVENSPYYTCTNDNSKPRCFIRPDPSPRSTKLYCSSVSNISGLYSSVSINSGLYNYSLTAINNTAITGNNIYGGSIDSCSEDIKNTLLNYLLNDSIANSISSDPFRVCLCDTNSEPDCSISDHQIEAFSGQQIQLSLVGVGQRDGTVPAVILSHTDPPGSSNNGSVTQSAPESCNMFSYTITSDKPSVILMLYPESLCPENSLHMMRVDINIKPCPPGFMLHNDTSSCVCDDSLKELDNSIECDINSQSFSHQHGVWIGYDQPYENVIYHPHCPFDYCTQEVSNFDFNSTDIQCRYNRSGLICGACSEGHSLTLGGSKCKKCSHFFLLLFLPLAIAGVVLMLFLIALKLTVSMGTINGLIFFANIVGTNSSIFLPSESFVVVRVFIAWLNLDLGIETCLFEGLDMYIKVWLQFVFPFYMFTLIGIIIIVSQRSSFVTKLLGSDPVAVLATLILVAYTKLFRAVLTVMSFTYIRSFDGSHLAVWLYDGNVRYLSGKHVPLFIFALLIMLFLIIPYTVILLFAPYLQRHSKNKFLFWINDYRLQSFLNAYYAPLKNKYRSWIGLLLVLRLCLLIVFVSNSLGDPSINLFAITTVICFLQCWRVFSGMFYTNWLFDALELFFILKLGVFSVATLYVLNTSGNQRALADTLVGVAFIVFVTITVYHTWRRLTDSRWWRLKLKPKLQKYFNSKNVVNLGVQEDSEKCEEPLKPPIVTTTVVELREPVMDFC